MPEEPDGDVEPEPEDEIALVRSKVRVPELRCCCRVAFPAEEPGEVVPKAQIIGCCLSELA
jgi:hypothetical protein